jgi:hypothetical protein
MRYMLDTNACIALIKRKPAAAIRRFTSLLPGDVGLSSITLAELRYGVAKSAVVEKNAEALAEFLVPLEIADFGTAAAEAYGHIADRSVGYPDRGPCRKPRGRPRNQQCPRVPPHPRTQGRGLDEVTDASLDSDVLTGQNVRPHNFANHL